VESGLPKENASLQKSARILIAKPASTFAEYALGGKLNEALC
jgi:hypothetical protein